MSIDAEIFSISPSEPIVHRTALELREARLEKIKANSELLGVEERMGQLIMEQMYWKHRLNTAEGTLVAEAALIADEAEASRTTKYLGLVATNKLSTTVPIVNSIEQVLKLVS